MFLCCVVVALFNAISEAKKEAAAKATEATSADSNNAEEEDTTHNVSRSLKEGLKAKLVHANSSSSATSGQEPQPKLTRTTQPKGSKQQKTEPSSTSTVGAVGSKKWAVFQDLDPALDHKLSLKVCLKCIMIFAYHYVAVYCY